MRAIVIPKHGDPSVLEVQERSDPPIRPGHVRIAVSAAGVNFADTMARTGLYAEAPERPAGVGYEVAGTVTELGEGVDGVATGTRVMAGTRFGGYASEVVVPVADAVALPDGLSFEQGAAIPVNYATAWAALLGFGSLRPGEKVLVHAAAGGVGLAGSGSGSGGWGRGKRGSSTRRRAASGSLRRRSPSTMARRCTARRRPAST